jgi:RNA polymerase sigma-70 factor (ECF subfamily)
MRCVSNGAKSKGDPVTSKMVSRYDRAFRAFQFVALLSPKSHCRRICLLRASTLLRRLSITNMHSLDYFAEIVDNYYAPLFRFALSLSKSESDASDLTQQTFLIWASKGHQLQNVAKVKTWLFTTLYRSFLMGRRRQKRFANEEFEAASGILEAEAVKSADSPAALAALAQIDEMFRAPVALFYLEDFSYAQIAETLHVPLGTVKSRIARGIAQLRTLLLSEHSSAVVCLPGKSGSLQRDLSISQAPEQLSVGLTHNNVLCHTAVGQRN